MLRIRIRIDLHHLGLIPIPTKVNVLDADTKQFQNCKFYPQTNLHKKFQVRIINYVFTQSIWKIRQPTISVALNNCQHWTGLEKTRVFLKKPSPVGFFGFFWVFLGFLGFFGFFWFFWVFCLDERVFRVFRVFFSFTNTFRCIQTLNYNHSY